MVPTVERALVTAFRASSATGGRTLRSSSTGGRSFCCQLVPCQDLPVWDWFFGPRIGSHGYMCRQWDGV